MSWRLTTGDPGPYTRVFWCISTCSTMLYQSNHPKIQFLHFRGSKLSKIGKNRDFSISENPQNSTWEHTSEAKWHLTRVFKCILICSSVLHERKYLRAQFLPILSLKMTKNWKKGDFSASEIPEKLAWRLTTGDPGHLGCVFWCKSTWLIVLYLRNHPKI